MQQSHNDHRRDLLQTLLIVGGIIGSVVSTVKDSQLIIQLLVAFVFFAILLYSLLSIDHRVVRFAVVFLSFIVALFFSVLLAVSAVEVQVGGSTPLLIAIFGTSTVFFALVYGPKGLVF